MINGHLKRYAKGILVVAGIALAGLSFSTEGVAGTASVMLCKVGPCIDAPYAPPGGNCTGEICDSGAQICCL